MTDMNVTLDMLLEWSAEPLRKIGQIERDLMEWGNVHLPDKPVTQWSSDDFTVFFVNLVESRDYEYSTMHQKLGLLRAFLHEKNITVWETCFRRRDMLLWNWVKARLKYRPPKTKQAVPLDAAERYNIVMYMRTAAPSRTDNAHSHFAMLLFAVLASNAGNRIGDFRKTFY